MVEVNHQLRSMRAKILYYGPATGGKTTNLQVLHRRAKQEKDLDLFSVDTAQSRTILFDLLPLSTPAFRDYQLRFQLIGVPGQKLYSATRKMLMKNADAIVFVANSASDRWNESVESYLEMKGFLAERDLDPNTIPLVLQFNKQDLGERMALEDMQKALNPHAGPSYLAVASKEQGVLETFAGALHTAVSELARRYNISELSHAQSIEEWVEQTMLLTFGVLKFDADGDYVSADPPELAESPPPPSEAKVVRVKTPSKQQLEPVPAVAQAASTAGRARPSSEPVAARPTPIPDPDLGMPLSMPVALSGNTAPPEPAPAPEPDPQGMVWGTVSAADDVQDTSSAQAMVESYAEAAVGLADHISDLREQKDSLTRRAADFSVVSKATRTLIADAAVDAHAVLGKMLADLAGNWEAAHGALYVSRPNGVLEPVIRHALELDPFKSPIDPDAPSEAVPILDGGQRIVQNRSEEGPLMKPIKRVGLECVAGAAFPLFTPTRRIGLLAFFFAQGAAAINLSESAHLDEVAFELSLGLHVLGDVRGSSWRL